MSLETEGVLKNQKRINHLDEQINEIEEYLEIIKSYEEVFYFFLDRLCRISLQFISFCSHRLFICRCVVVLRKKTLS